MSDPAQGRCCMCRIYKTDDDFVCVVLGLPHTRECSCLIEPVQTLRGCAEAQTSNLDLSQSATAPASS